MAQDLQILPGGTSYIGGGLDGSILNSGGTRNISGGPSGVADFDRDTSIAVICPSTLNLNLYNEDISFNMYLDVSNFSTLSFMINNAGPGTTPSQSTLIVYLTGNYLCIDLGGGTGHPGRVDITDFAEQIVNVKFKRQNGSQHADLVYVMFNDVSQNLTNLTSSIGLFDFFKIGTGGNPTVPQFQYPMFNGTFWDIDFPNLHHWKGYPAGNTNAAWVDEISVDGSVISNLNIGQINNEISVLDFTGNEYLYFLDDPSSEINYSKKVTFNLWLDNSSGYSGTADIINFYGNNPPGSSDADVLSIRMDGSLIHLSAQYPWGGPLYAIAEDYNNQVLNLEVNKGTKSIESFKINGVTQTPLYDASILSITDAFMFGLNLSNATIWDIKIYDTSSAGELTHHWPGYPNGNTDAAWVDQIGTADPCVLTFSGDPSVRQIGTLIEAPNKLQITGGLIPPGPPKNAPILYKPFDTSIIGNTDPSVAWYSVSDASSYWLQVDDDPAFGSLLYDVSGITNLYYNLSGLDNSTAYYWRARSINPYGVSPWSETWEFYTPSAEFPFIALGSASDSGYYTTDIGQNWTLADFSPYSTNLSLINGQSFGQNRNSAMWRDKLHIILGSRNAADNHIILLNSSDGGYNFSLSEVSNINVYYSTWVPEDGSVRLHGWSIGAISKDFGASWENITLASGRSAVNYASSYSGEYVYAGTASFAGVQNSSDYGQNWVDHDFNGSHMIVTCDDSGQYVGGGYGAYGNDVPFSNDYGNTWIKLVSGTQGRIMISPDATRMIFNNEASSGYYVSSNYGASWSNVASPWSDGQNTGTSYYETLDGSIYLERAYQDKIVQLNAANNGFSSILLYPDTSIHGHAISAFGRGMIYSTPNTAAPYEVYYSQDLSTWTQIFTSDVSWYGYLTCQ